MGKTKALISFAVTAKLICAFVFAYADCWFSHVAAHMVLYVDLLCLLNIFLISKIFKYGTNLSVFWNFPDVFCFLDFIKGINSVILRSL